MNAPSVSPVTVATATSTSVSAHPAGGRGPEQRAIGRLIGLVSEVVAGLETAGKTPGLPLCAAIAECNLALERSLEVAREPDRRDDLIATARDDLRRLVRLLTVVDRSDVPFVMRQIRRVLGRFDTCCA